MDSDDPGIIRIMDTMVDESQELFKRGLAARALGAVCMKVTGARAKVLTSERWAPLVDSLLDMVGACDKQTSYVEADRNCIRRNACMALSLLMDGRTAMLQNNRKQPKKKEKRKASTEDPPNPVEPFDGSLFSQWAQFKMESVPFQPRRPKQKLGSSPSRSTTLSLAATQSSPSTSSGASGMKGLMKHVKSLAPRPSVARPRSSVLNFNVPGEENVPPPPPPAIKYRKPTPTSPGATQGLTKQRGATPDSSVTKPLDLASMSEILQASSTLSHLPPSSVDSAGHRGDLLGFFYTAEGKVLQQVNWRKKGPKLRPSVIFGDAMPKDDSFVPNTDPTNFFERDKKLGYQVRGYCQVTHSCPCTTRERTSDRCDGPWSDVM